MMGILDMESIYDEFMVIKDLTDKQLAYQNKPLATTRMDIFGEVEIHSVDPKQEDTYPEGLLVDNWAQI